LVIPASAAALWQARLSWRVDIGSTGFCPGNSHPPGSILPRALASRHQARSRSSKVGDSIA
jgi:hypothetical protein